MPIIVWSPRSLPRWMGHGRFAEMEALRRGVNKPARSLATWFQPRQLLIRGKGRTSVLHVAPRWQVVVLALALLGLAAALLGVFTAARDHRAAGRMASEMENLRSTARLESERAQEDRELLGRLGRELTRRSAELDKVSATAQADGRTVAQQKGDIERLVTEREAAIDHAIAERTRVAHERDAALAERDAALAERDAALAANRDTLSRLDAETRNAIADVERIISATGLDPGRIVKLPASKSRTAPRGGPFIAWREPAAETSPDMRIRGVTSDLGRLRALSEALAHLPVGGPLIRLEISDGFGFRIDPLSGRASLHEGVDLSAPRGAPVRATAAGTVSFVGWNGEYGNMVEIDHGLGLATRYAHLTRALVRPGQTVTLHQPIGLVGDSGRVTGVHLHYEVRVNGQARNPITFLGASRHVREANSHPAKTTPVAARSVDRH
jgi:murein DD-endopeptidase MepM/ murein hydrolase activator NlpD